MSNNIMGLTERLFDQIDALMCAKSEDKEAFRMELERSRAMCDLADSICETSKVALDAAKTASQMKYVYAGKTVAVPSYLLEGGSGV